MSRRMRFLVLSLLPVLLAGAFAARLGKPATAAEVTVEWKVPVTAANTVSVGDTLTWVWADALPHSVSSVSGPVPFDSGTRTGNGTMYSFTFTQPGTYTYRCNIHPNGMTGTVVVQGSTTETPTASPTVAGSTPSPTTAASSPAGAKTVTLGGSEEVPPVTTTASGSFEWALAGATLSYRLRASGAELRAAHLHLGARGTNGPVVVTLFNNPAGVSSIDVSGSVAVSDLSGPAAGNMADFLAALRAGNLYVNVHSADHPAGVLRGQVPAQPAPPAAGNGLQTNPESSGRRFGVVIALGIALAVGSGFTAFGLRRRHAAHR